MKKILLAGAILLFSGYNAQASGLYFGLGYSQSKPDMKFNTISGASSDTGPDGIYEGLADLPGWPGSNDANEDDLWAYRWDEDLPEVWKYYPESTSTYSFSVGWAIPQNPFRFEFEFLKTSFKVKDWDMMIYPGSDGKWCSDQTCSGDTIPTNEYIFYLTADSDAEVMKFDVNSYLVNVLFEIPGLGDVDPYVGFGYGFSKIKSKNKYGSGGTNNEPTHQFIVGVEYRVPESPLIVGLEYKKLKMNEGEEIDEPFSSFEYKEDIIMFKLKYDFISDVI